MYECNENTSALVQFTVYDAYGNVVPVANISTATMTLYDYDTKEVINSVSGTDIRSNIDASGVCSIWLHGVDNIILDESKLVEKHTITIAISGINNTEIHQDIDFCVTNQKIE